MHRAIIVDPYDEERAAAEAFIRHVYNVQYGAQIASFPEHLIVRCDAAGKILCAAGLRLADDGFFSETYLNEPVEKILARLTGLCPERGDVFEVTTLASRSPSDISGFIGDIVGFGAQHALSWSFFTLTRRLSQLIRRLHLAPLHLADAHAHRVSDPAAWGSYYATEPKVFAVNGLALRPAPVPSFPSLLARASAPLAEMR